MSVVATYRQLRGAYMMTATQSRQNVVEALREVHEEVKARFYGCGSPIPPAVEGITVLDVGCGSGRDCYVVSKLVGPDGRVIGVDMTDEQLAVARTHPGYHAEKFGCANVEFRQGYIEDLRSLGVADESVDLVVSNCVLNLSPSKPQAFAEIMRVLAPGGELYFADRRIPASLLDDPVLVGECLSGALYTEDFRRIMARSGCADVRVVSASPVTMTNPRIEQKIGFIGFTSQTIRAFKLALEDRCEDFGQIATYRGTMSEHPHFFDLDDHHRFTTGKPMLVCGNTADMLTSTRYRTHFTVAGDKATHYGLFACGPADQPSTTGMGTAGSCC